MEPGDDQRRPVTPPESMSQEVVVGSNARGDFRLLNSLSGEIISYIFTFVPSSRFFMFRCVRKFYYDVFPDVVIPSWPLAHSWIVAFNCLKVSMPFIQDFSPVWLIVSDFYFNSLRLNFINRMCKQYFGDEMQGGFLRPYPVVNPDDLFPAGEPVCPIILTNWIISCVSTLVTLEQHPARCLGALRLAGFFSTKVTRSKLRVSLRKLKRRLRMRSAYATVQMKLIVRFLIELSKKSFGFSNICVNSRAWWDLNGMTRIGLDPGEFRNLVVDLREEDFDRLYLEFRTRYPLVFPVMSFGLTLPVLIQ